MNVPQLEDWICTLEEQQKLKAMQVFDLSHKLNRIKTYESSEQEIAIDCMVHEIRRMIEHKVEGFADLYKPDTKSKSTQRAKRR